MSALTLAEIAAQLGGQVQGDPAIRIRRVATLEAAAEGDIAFLANPRYLSQLTTTRASAVILAPVAAQGYSGAAIVTDSPYLYFARLAQCLSPAPTPRPGLGSGAISESAIPPTVEIGAGAWIGAEVMLGDDVIIGPGCRIHDHVSIGSGTRLCANTVIYADCVLGKRNLIHAGAVIGADGFGFARTQDGRWEKIPQTGRVLIGDDVEIGANTTIDRGALDDTVIENGVKLDNQIQIAHNVRVGAHTAMAACVGVAGSARIGARCTLGGGAIVLGHIELADDVHVSAGTVIAKSVTQSGSYTGTVPFQPHADWLKNFSRVRHLDAMADKIRALEKRLADLEKKA